MNQMYDALLKVGLNPQESPEEPEESVTTDYEKILKENAERKVLEKYGDVKLTPEKSLEILTKITTENSNDVEGCHVLMDELLTNILYQNGYEEVSRKFIRTTKWYA